MRAFRLHSCASRSVKARCAGRFPRLGGARALTARQRFAPMGGDGRRGGWRVAAAGHRPRADGGRRVISGGPHSTGQAKSLLNGQETTASVTCDHPWSLEVPTRQDSEIEAPNRRSTEDDAVGHTLIVTFRSIVPHGPYRDPVKPSAPTAPPGPDPEAVGRRFRRKIRRRQPASILGDRPMALVRSPMPSAPCRGSA